MLSIAAVRVSAGGSAELQVNRVETLADKSVRLGRPWAESDNWPLVYREPGQELVVVMNVDYDPGSGRSADLYYPPGFDPATLGPRPRESDGPRFPVLLFPAGLSAERFAAGEDSTPRESATSVGFASLYANSGVVSVVYDADEVIAGLEAMLRFLGVHAGQLRIDLSRVGVWATSGNGRLASRVMSRPDLIDSIRACIFIHADANLTVMPPHAAYFVASSRDGTDIERYSATLVRRAVARGLTVEHVDNVSYKNFFLSDESTEARRIIERSVRFAERHLVETSLGPPQEER
ncbi:MAG: hypothetical protein ACOC37_05025 [Spirochaetota bacterium]